VTYSIEIIKKGEQKTMKWSGGTTTQIAIFPPTAEYSNRNFIWRLSSARIDLDESTFTALPGISRILMVLDGEIRLVHEGHHRIPVKPFEQDRFCGDWPTKSFGKASDFNLMMAPGCDGALTALPLGAKESIAAAEPAGMDRLPRTSAFYCVDGSVCFTFDHEAAQELQAGDVLLLHRNHDNDKLSLLMNNLENKKVHVIRADMQYQARF
jgi:environmental stress-induced protein Ves